jgi:hypothetical protein
MRVRDGRTTNRRTAMEPDVIAAAFEKNCREMYDQMARIAVVASWVRFYDFGAGRMPGFLKELAERNRS